MDEDLRHLAHRFGGIPDSMRLTGAPWLTICNRRFSFMLLACAFHCFRLILLHFIMSCMLHTFLISWLAILSRIVPTIRSQCSPSLATVPQNAFFVLFCFVSFDPGFVKKIGRTTLLRMLTLFLVAILISPYNISWIARCYGSIGKKMYIRFFFLDSHYQLVVYTS